MSWTVPKTWAVGDVLTAGDMNTYVRDNGSWLGTDKPMCRVSRTIASSITSATWTSIPMDLERFDNTNMHDPVSNTSRITFATGGKYLVGGSISWGVSSAGAGRGARVLWTTGGSGLAITHQSAAPSTSVGSEINLMTLWSFAAADYVELQVWQDSGAGLNVSQTSDESPEFWAVWMGN